MKRYGYLYPQITSFENLLLAAKKAQKNKRKLPSVLKFNHNLEAELLQLQQELETQTYQPGPYRTFEIYEPKPRLISAAPYRDRVVHHALCNIIQPLIDRTFNPDTYANRTGYGTHRALKRFTHFARTSRYILQCDIRRYFPNIDHDILKTLIRRHLRCPRTLDLIDTIIDSSTTPLDIDPTAPLLYFPGDDLLSPLRPKGLPIGNLTSQFFANLYLSRFDHFVYQTLKPSGYLRYVDDFALFSNDRAHLIDARQSIETYLTNLRLQIHPIKSQCFATHHGANFLGFRVLPTYIRLQKRYLQRSRRHFKRLKFLYRHGNLTLHKLQQSIQSWNAHIAQGNTWKISQRIVKIIPPQWLCLNLEQAT
jgi:retron-type reverse transcriptase